MYKTNSQNQESQMAMNSIDIYSLLFLEVKTSEIGGQYDLNVVKDTEELAKIPSIFTICKYAADTDESMKIDIDGDKIAIVLSDNSFQNYKMLINMPSLLPVFHAMVIVPALIFTFETLRREGTEEYENRRWYMAIRKTLAKYEILLNNEILNDIPSYD